MFSILVAEDDKNLNRMICAKLKQERYHAFPAFDGEEALEIMEREHLAGKRPQRGGAAGVHGAGA